MRYPTDNNRITSEFGMRWNNTDYHYGADYGAFVTGIEGDNIYAIADGVVKVAKLDGSTAQNPSIGYGYYVIVEHDGYCSLYAHLDKLKVSPGQKVTEETVIGLMGDSGRATGIHLHLEIRNVPFDDNFWVTYTHTTGKKVPMYCVDPVKFIEERMVKEPVVSPWAEKAIEWAVKNKISDGTRLKESITREESIVMLYRALTHDKG